MIESLKATGNYGRVFFDRPNIVLRKFHLAKNERAYYTISNYYHIKLLVVFKEDKNGSQ